MEKKAQFFLNLRRMRYVMLLLIVIVLSSTVSGQKEFTIACIAFYNLENLFDTIDSPDTEDFEFTPMGPNLYNSHVYYDKLDHLATVISQMGVTYTPDGPAIIGVSEIENRSVLEDLVRHPLLRERGYRILHQDSKDARGVDVALLYQPKYFIPDTVAYYSLITSETNGKADAEVKYSRDIQFAIGRLDGESVIISVNHWPSRRGGEQTTAHLRNEAAKYNRVFLDSMALHHHITKSIVMGDLNDDPTNDSVKKYLRAKKSTDEMDKRDMYNPYEVFYRKGMGTTAYRDAWSLFDQIILSHDMAVSQEGFRHYKAEVFNPPYLTQKSGPFKGYPFRTYSNGVYIGGYSDHFPVFVLVVKEKA